MRNVSLIEIQEVPAGDVPPEGTTIFKLTLGMLDGLSEDDMIQLMRAASQSAAPLTQMLASERLRQQLRRQPRSHWRARAVGGLLTHHIICMCASTGK